MDNKTLTQIQINKQILLLALQQDDLNSVLGLMLASAECLSNRFGKEKKESFFAKYNLNNAGNTKNEKNLKDQLKIQTKIFRNNYKYMIGQKGKYPFPDNLGKDEIKNIVNYWKQNSKPENQIYFDNIIQVLEEKYILNYPGKNNNNVGLPPEGIIEFFPKAMEYVDAKRDEVLKKIEKTRYYKNELDIGKNKYDTFDYKDDQYIKNNSHSDTELNLIRSFDNVFNKAENYYVLLVKNYNYKCNFGDIKQYDKNNITFLENDLNNSIKTLKKYYEDYSKHFPNAPQEIYVYEEYANKWFQDTKNYIFKNLVDAFIC